MYNKQADYQLRHTDTDRLNINYTILTQCRYGVVDIKLVCCTLFALKMKPVEGRNVCGMFLASCLTVIFELKLLVFSQLYRVPKYIGSHYGTINEFCCDKTIFLFVYATLWYR